MSLSIDIKKLLIQKINDCPSVEEVYGFEKPNPEGFPAVFIRPTDMEGEFASNLENSRVYAYRVLIIFPVGKDFIPDSEKNRLDYAEDVVAQVIDEIINAVDTDYVLDGTTVLFVNAADVVWGDYNLENGVARAAELTLRVYTEYRVQ